MGLAFVSVDFEARKNAYLFQQSLKDNSEENLRGFFFDGWSYLFITDQRLGKWDSIFGKEKSVVDLQDVDAIIRHEKLTGPKVVVTKKDGSEVELVGSWIADPDDISLLQQIHAGSDPSDEDSRRDYLFDASSEQIPVPPSLHSPQSKAAIKQAVAWEKKRAKWEEGGRSKEEAPQASDQRRRNASAQVQQEFSGGMNELGNIETDAREGAKELPADKEAQAKDVGKKTLDSARKREAKQLEKVEKAVRRNVAKVQSGLLPGEECIAAVGKLTSTVFVSNMRIGVAKPDGLIVEDFRLEDVEGLRIEEAALGAKLMLKSSGAKEVKLWSGPEVDEARRFVETFEKESLSPQPLFSDLLVRYENAMVDAMDRTRKKADPNRNWLLRAIYSHSDGKPGDAVRALGKVLSDVGSFDDFKAIVSRFVKSGDLDSDYQPQELFEGHSGWFSDKEYIVVFPKALVVKGTYCKLSGATRAEVVEEGQDSTEHVYEGQFFTGVTALLIGRGGSNRKVGEDNRQAFLVVTDPKWQQSVQLHPDRVGEAKKFVRRLEQKVAGFELPAARPAVPAMPSSSSGGRGVADELSKLKGLLDQGAISEEEYTAAKRKVLGN